MRGCGGQKVIFSPFSFRSPKTKSVSPLSGSLVVVALRALDETVSQLGLLIAMAVLVYLTLLAIVLSLLYTYPNNMFWL